MSDTLSVCVTLYAVATLITFHGLLFREPDVRAREIALCWVVAALWLPLCFIGLLVRVYGFVISRAWSRSRFL